VFKRYLKFFKELDGRVKVPIAGTGIYYWTQRLTTQYIQLYAMDLGANAFEIGVLNSVAAALSSIVTIPLGWAIEKFSVKRVMLLGFACAAISACFFSLAIDWWMLIPAFLIGSKLVRIYPLTDIIFVSATKPQIRASVMSLSRVVWGILNIFAPITAALIVVEYGGINAQGIRPLFYIQLMLTTFVFLFIARELPPLSSQTGIERKKSEFFQGYHDFFKGEKWLKRWIVLRSIRQFGINLAMPFVPLWMVNVKGANPYILGVIGTTSVITSLVLQIPMGKKADKIGRKKVYFMLRPVSYAGTLLLILSPRPEYLILVGLLGAIAIGGEGGGVGGVSHISFITMFWEMVPQEKMGRWFGLEGIMFISTVPATILGGILWQKGFMTEVLLLPIILEILVVMPILATVPDTLVKS
jgi:MFS family permease